MAQRSFVHLHCHSHYSLLDGANRIPELVAQTRKLGMNAIALTDHGNLYGAIEFYNRCKEAGINPIVGYEAYVAPTRRDEKDARRRGEAGFHLTLLAKNRIGFHNLIKMSSIAFLEGYHYVPRIDKEILEAHSEGVICLSGCASSEFSEFILRDQMTEATRLAEWFQKVFRKNFYIEIQNNGLAIQETCAAGAIDIARKIGAPLVATCDAHYLCQSDASAHDVLLCINTGKTLDDPNRMRYGSDLFYVRGAEEMYRLFPEQADAVQRSQEIADGVDIDLDFKARHFPVYTPPKGKTPEQYLRDLCLDGLHDRYGPEPSQAVLDRMEHELGIICRMGFAGYFLIVGDFVRFAMDQKIPCSARGSACGSLVSYVLKLSHVDPLEYDLLFERFLDPNRSEAPDIDIDFCQDRREEVITYVKQKYGEGSVAQIATFGTMAARAAIKDVGRVMQLPLERVNQLTKMIPNVQGITLVDSLEKSSDFKAAYDGDPDVRRVVDIAIKLEGTNRNAGTHAAGVVISNGPLTDYVPLQRVVRKGDDGGDKQGAVAVTTQWGMTDLEKVGMLKMDFLGLRTLTLLDNCCRLIEKTRGIRIDLYRLPLDDAETYALLQRGDAKGIFQLESDGIRELLKRMRPDNIRDIIAIMALYRPGPLEGGMVDSYVNCKHGREKPQYAHPVMEEVLSETYGVMVYQEQVMRILNRLGGIELSSAYACIKAISRKKYDVIDKRKQEFIEGSKDRNLPETTAREIFEKIVLFGGYGFNKSHTAAYAYIGYHTAYLKMHFTAEFMAALLSSEIEDANKRDFMVQHMEDARRLGVEVHAPNVNRSESEFSVQQEKIVFGLTAIKGVGRGAAEEVVRARQEGGIFRDLFDLCERIDTRLVGKKAIEQMIKAGATDDLGGHRAQLLAALPRALQSAIDRLDAKRRGQRSLFDSPLEEDSRTTALAEPLPEVPAWSDRDRLKYEKEVLDFYFSSHPLTLYQKDLQRFSSHTVSSLMSLPADMEATVGGMMVGVRIRTTRKGNGQFAALTLEDLSGSIEAVLWSDSLQRYRDLVADDNMVIARGTIKRDRETPLLVISRLLSLEQASKELARELWIQLKVDRHRPSHIDVVAEVLRRTPGNCPVMLDVCDPLGRHAVMRLGRAFAINPATFQREELESLLGENSVMLR